MNRHLVSEEGREEHPRQGEQYVQRQEDVLVELCNRLSTIRG